jgi:citrate lyase subunit beta/citryl-CoA lyase
MSSQHRSYLYVPANRPHHIDNAYRTDADAIVLDLEDAVPAAEKAAARAIVTRTLRRPPAKPTYVRVNAISTGLTEDDIGALAGPTVAGVWLPKTEHVADVRQAAAWLAAAGCPAGLHLLIESARGVVGLPELIAASPSVAAVSLGETDLGADLRASSGAALESARARCVLEARVAGLPSPAQSIHRQIHDSDGLRTSTESARDAGFFGRTVLHPVQLGVVNAVFTPARAEVEDARAMLSLLSESTRDGRGAAVTTDGRFVDAAVVRHATDVLELAAQLGVVREDLTGEEVRS